MVGRRRKKGIVAVHGEDPLTRQYGKIGISALAAAAPYQSGIKESDNADSKSKNAPKEAEKTQLRGTSSRR
jgi:hypothetical protein